MLGKEIILKQYDYTCQANGRILEAAAKVSEAQLTTPNDYSHGSLHDLIFHIMHIEWVWRLLCQKGEVQPENMPRKEDFRSVGELASWWADEQRAMKNYLNDLDEDGLASVVTVSRWDGTKTDMIVWHMLNHMMLHGMQHRSEAAVLLTQYSQSPGNLDFIFFL